MSRLGFGLKKQTKRQNSNLIMIGAGTLLRSCRQKPPDLQPQPGTFVTVWKKISDILFLKLPTEGQHSGRYTQRLRWGRRTLLLLHVTPNCLIGRNSISNRRAVARECEA